MLRYIKDALSKYVWGDSPPGHTITPINGHVRQLNWRRSSRAHNTQCLRFKPLIEPLTEPIDLTKSHKFYPVWDQGHLGSCTANGICGLYWFEMLNRSEASENFVPSRLYFYYKEREKEGHISTDVGAEIPDGIDVLSKVGVCSETKWPYDIAKFADKPPTECDDEAQRHRSINSKSVNQSLNDLIVCLQAGYMVTFGFDVYQSFKSIDKSGLVSMPKSDEKLLGGHCVDIVGYDPIKKLFKVVNSWGSGWGDGGFCYFPEDYILSKMSSDFFIVTNVTDEQKLQSL